MPSIIAPPDLEQFQELGETASELQVPCSSPPAWLFSVRRGWRMDNGQVEVLPVFTVSRPDAQEMQIPLEARLSAQLAEDLAESGFTLLVCKPNRDRAYVLRAPMLHSAEVYDDEAATATSKDITHLPYQLLASRISEAVTSRMPQLHSSSLSANELASAIGEYVQQLLANTGAGASVSNELQAEPDKQGKRQLVLKVHTGKQIVNGADSFDTTAYNA